VAALTSTTITTAGVAASASAVAASDTIAEAEFGSTGVILRIINGGASTDNVSVADPGLTPSGNAGTVTPVAVATGVTKIVFIPRSAIDPSTLVATVTHDYTTSVTYELYRI